MIVLIHFLNGILMIALGLGAGILLTRRFRLGWGLWGIGAATFVLSQVGHIPFNALATLAFQRGWLPTPPLAWTSWFNPVFLGLSAGLWEECARYATYRWWARSARSWRTGLLLGAGHGGIEAIILGGLALVTFVRLFALKDADLSAVFPPDQLALATQQVQAYWSLPAWYPLLAVWERFFTILVHLALSVVVLQCFTRQQARWLWLAVAFHALVDAVTVYVLPRFGSLAAEGVVAGFGLLSLAIIFALRSPEPQPAANDAPAGFRAPAGFGAPPLPPLDFQMPAPTETPDNIEQSRYHNGL